MNPLRAESVVDRLSKKKRSWLMSRVRSRGSVIERTIAKGLDEAGLSYETQCKDIIGKPDFAFRRAKVAVFCDSEFWHGYRIGQKKLQGYSPFWQEKLARNKKRDAFVTKTLRAQGWSVIRLRGKEITRDPASCVSRITAEIQSSQQNSSNV